jgi:PAP2 superfamily
MTTTFWVKKQTVAAFFLTIAITISLLGACKKNEEDDNNAVSKYSAEVLDKWMTMQLRLMRNATGIPNQTFSRHYVYAGITAVEALAPGLPSKLLWSGKWNGLTDLPQKKHSKDYFYPANVNAALAYINKAMFVNASLVDKAAIDSLENALNLQFVGMDDQGKITESSTYGKAVATAVFNWAETDGYQIANSPYTAPVGAGLWVPTAPAFAAASTPYWGNNRPVIAGSAGVVQLPVLPVYSTDPNSAFYKMVKQVYDTSQTLSDDKKAMALFWRDVPGATSPGHWVSIVQQVIRQTSSKLDEAAIAYALTGAAVNDGLISCWKNKYQFNLERPITFIRDVMNYPTWTSYLPTPPHPEFTSAHAVLSVGAAGILQGMFGNIGTFTDHTYDYLGFVPRSYSSFDAIGLEAGNSRLFGGIHYQISIDAGIIQGKEISKNILNKRFGF